MSTASPKTSEIDVLYGDAGDGFERVLRNVSENWLDRGRHPTWLQVFPSRYTDEELGAAFDHLDACIEHFVGDRPVSLVVDISMARVGNSRQRKRISKSFKRTTARIGDRVAGQAFVVSTAVQQAAMTATLWLFRPPWPIRVFRSREDAFRWLAGVHASDEDHRDVV